MKKKRNDHDNKDSKMPSSLLEWQTLSHVISETKELEIVHNKEEEGDIEEEEREENYNDAWPMATLVFKIHYVTPYGYKVAIAGDTKELGEWDFTKARLM